MLIIYLATGDASTLKNHLIIPQTMYIPIQKYEDKYNIIYPMLAVFFTC